MRWQKPKEGDRRTITKFALTPIYCESGERAWREKVTIEQEYGRVRVGGTMPYEYLAWVNMRFVDR